MRHGEQLELPGMPEPLTPEPVEPFMVDVEVTVSITVKADLAGLIEWNRQNAHGWVTEDGQPRDYDALTDEVLADFGYTPAERGEVFLYNTVEDMLDVSCDLPGRGDREWLLHSWIDIKEIELRPRWQTATQDALDAHMEPRYVTP